MRLSLDLPDDAQTVRLCRLVTRTALRELGIASEKIAEIELVVGEATGNAVRHAYTQPGNRYQFMLEFHADRVRVEVVDHGDGFLRHAIAEPKLEDPGGRGIGLVEELADEVTIATLPGEGCRLAAEFLFPSPPGAGPLAEQ